MKKLAVLMGICLTLLTLVACNNDVETEVNTYTISFESNGGSVVENQTVEENQLLTEPTNPTKDGFEFEYWYLEDESVAFDFSTTKVTEDMTLNAYWTEIVYDVVFNVDGGTEVSSQEVKPGETVSQPDDPTKEGSEFRYWYSNNPSKPYDFTTKVNADLTLTALWISEEEINNFESDIALIEQNLYSDPYGINIPEKGENGTTVLWYSDSDNISSSGIAIPTSLGDEEESAKITVIYIYKDLSETKTYDYVLPQSSPVEIATSKTLNFENLTTEYDIEDSAIELFYEENGSVPYVSILDFLDLLEGFIDPEVEISQSYEDGVLELSYQYYDENEDILYDLICTIDTVNDTISTNDPGFYWAYVYSTETNYGRHITYDYDNPNTYYSDSEDIVYDLKAYNLDMTVYNDEVVLPFYLANQLFAGSSYYNVYYNQDALYGIYSLPDSDSDEYETMKTSSANGAAIPSDLLIHTYHTLAFDMDYFYGLKEFKNIDTFYDLLSEEIDNLLNPLPLSVEEGLKQILINELDEPHTSYGYPSYYNNLSYGGPALNTLSAYGPRLQDWYNNGLFKVDDVIAEKWGIDGSDGWSVDSSLRPYYWFLDEEQTVVMLSLDSFSTADIEESTEFDYAIVEDIVEVDLSTHLPALTGGSKYFYYNSSTEENQILELLVKGLEDTDIEAYKQALLDNGYVLNTDADGNAFYVNDTFTVQVAYDQTYNLSYVSVIDKVTLATESLEVNADIMDTVISDNAVYMEVMLEAIENESANVTDVILDLSFNTGGNVGALYRVVGFITDEPFSTSSISADTKSESTTYVKIEGVPVYDHLNWSLLTSKVTFSAANAMATIFQENDLGLVIGQQSGGGTSSITPILLPNGTAFTMSSNSMNAYRTGSGTEEDPYVYINNELGIVPDEIIDVEDLYNEVVLLEILAQN